jgi:transposase InsO family protein
MREDTRPAYAAADGVHRPLAGLRHHRGHRGKTHQDKPRVYRPLPQKRQGSPAAEREKPHPTLASLKSRIPIRTFYTSEERKKPGFWQIDTVHHCGQATSGQYLHTLTATDVASGWIELHSLLNNAHKWTFQALSHIKTSVILPVLEFHSDNGSEFINNATETWCKGNGIPFTRSRDHKKNDNCFVEQKNGAVVREYVGYDRLEGLQEQALLAAVYQPLTPLLNFFMPTQKLKSKTRVGSKESKLYDEPISPFQRLIEANDTPQQTKDALLTQIALYNPVELQHNVNKAVIRLRQRLAQSNRIITKGDF